MLKRIRMSSGKITIHRDNAICLLRYLDANVILVAGRGPAVLSLGR